MNTIFLISHVALWLLFLIQSVAIIVILRQIGVLHLRLSPAGARFANAGPRVGRPMGEVTLVDIDFPSRALRISEKMPRDVFLLFVSPSLSSMQRTDAGNQTSCQ
jgi:hypothetical protein